MSIEWTDMPPTEEGYYLFRNKAISRGLKQAYCIRYTPKGPLMQSCHAMGVNDTPVKEIFGHWWYGPIPSPPEREDGFDIRIAIKDEEERRAISIK